MLVAQPLKKELLNISQELSGRIQGLTTEVGAGISFIKAKMAMMDNIKPLTNQFVRS